MSLEFPLIQSIVSAVPDSKISLAALGISFATCMMFEAPILMLVSAGAALVNDWNSYQKLRNFTHLLCLSMCTLLGITTLALQKSGALLHIANGDPVLAEKVFQSLLIYLPVPFLVGNRRFLQGVLIRAGKSFLISIGTGSRIVLIAGVGLALAHFSDLHGAIVGAIAGTAGVLAESLIITILAAIVRRDLRNSQSDESGLTYKDIISFYAPLAISGVVNLSVLPLLTFFMSQGNEPVLSVASYQILQGMLFFLSSVALAFQEVVVSVLGQRPRAYPILKNFALFVAVGIGIGFIGYVCTPLCRWVTVGVLGIDATLFDFLQPALYIAMFVPLVGVFAISLRAVMVVERKTSWVTAGSVVELVSVVILMQSFAIYDSSPALFHAVTSLLISRLIASSILWSVFLKVRERYLAAR